MIEQDLVVRVTTESRKMKITMIDTNIFIDLHLWLDVKIISLHWAEIKLRELNFKPLFQTL